MKRKVLQISSVENNVVKQAVPKCYIIKTFNCTLSNKGTSQLKRSQNIFQQILVNFKTNNLAKRVFVKEWERWFPEGLG